MIPPVRRLTPSILLGFLPCLLLLFVCPALHASDSPRQKLLIDAGWRFQPGDIAGAERPGFDDQHWQSIGLPHSFGMPYFGASRFYIGYGWYRRHLQLAALKPDQRAALEFEAAFQDAQVFVNGAEVGAHQGGYTGFSFDITAALKPGDNVIAVRLNNNWNPQLNPRAGEHNFNGGIYRNVYLVTTSDLRVDWYGTFVTTPGLDKAGGPVHIATDIRNSRAQPRSFTLRTDILDETGRTAATVTTENTVAAASVQTVEQHTPFIPQPALWAPAHPHMYTAVSHVIADGREVDRYTTPFGFRWVRWTAEEGFFLNGEHYYFHGADVHQDHAGWGDAVTNAGIARDVRLVKEAGMDFIRGSHYPHSPVFSDECDRQGVLLWSENAFWGTGGQKAEGSWSSSAYPPHEQDQKPFEANVEHSLAEMIRIHRNHPSIIVWSMTNEVFFSDANLLPKIRAFIPVLVAESHRLDPTRLAGAGGVQRGDLDKLADVAGYNGDGATLFIDPGVPSAVTEYGSLESDRPGPYVAGWGDMAGQPEFAWRGGQALWCAFDHGSIFPSLGRTGMIDYFRLPKQQWYWYRNAYRGIAPPEPAKPGTPVALRLESDGPTLANADGTGDVQLRVSVLDSDGKRLSNSPPVELAIVDGPGEFPTGRTIEFRPDSDIVIRAGEAAIEMRSYQGGSIDVRATSPGLRPADLVVRAEGGPPFIAGVTPLAASRPYAPPPVPARIESVPEPPIDISLNRPTGASSESGGHSSRFANDGDPRTFWEPGGGDPQHPWWQVDFESHCLVKSLRLGFAEAGDYRYLVQISDDHGGWETVIDRSAGGPAEAARTETLPNHVRGRILRVQFLPSTGQGPLRLVEVQVLGSPVQ
jgi:hypothetical protein